jgi:D-sedoheptulose 7-phosphate isomerase
MLMETAYSLAEQIETRLLLRNEIFERYFSAEARPLAEACREMSERFLRGGRLLALGRGPYATDAQHVSVEFVHPVIVGKRALPALDLSLLMQPWLDAIVRPDDMVMGFGPPEGDLEVWSSLQSALTRGAMTFALPGPSGRYALKAATQDAFMHQELIEILCHTLWETVHVFFEHRELGQDIGQTEFLYPFLGKQKQETSAVVDDVAASIQMKVHDDKLLRTRLAREESEEMAGAALDMHSRLQNGGKLILLGNGGSATDANDWAIDCVMPPAGYHPIPAISLAMEPAIITAMANDVGIEVIFLRQMLAQAQSNDVIIAISTSGGSRNVVAAMEEARKRNLMTVALLGNDGGEIYRRGLANHPIIVRSDYIPRIQEVQASAYHVLRDTLEVLHNGDA